jgi:hypothetical protein
MGCQVRAPDSAYAFFFEGEERRLPRRVRALFLVF